MKSTQKEAGVEMFVNECVEGAIFPKCEQRLDHADGNMGVAGIPMPGVYANLQ